MKATAKGNDEKPMELESALMMPLIGRENAIWPCSSNPPTDHLWLKFHSGSKQDSGALHLSHSRPGIPTFSHPSTSTGRPGSAGRSTPAGQIPPGSFSLQERVRSLFAGSRDLSESFCSERMPAPTCPWAVVQSGCSREMADAGDTAHRVNLSSGADIAANTRSRSLQSSLVGHLPTVTRSLWSHRTTSSSSLCGKGQSTSHPEFLQVISPPFLVIWRESNQHNYLCSTFELSTTGWHSSRKCTPQRPPERWGEKLLPKTTSPCCFPKSVLLCVSASCPCVRVGVTLFKRMSHFALESEVSEATIRFSWIILLRTSISI